MVKESVEVVVIIVVVVLIVVVVAIVVTALGVQSHQCMERCSDHRDKRMEERLLRHMKAGVVDCPGTAVVQLSDHHCLPRDALCYLVAKETVETQNFEYLVLFCVPEFEHLGQSRHPYNRWTVTEVGYRNGSWNQYWWAPSALVSR